MATNQYFNNYNHTGEQDLIEENVIESIQIKGVDVKYLVREDVSVDYLFKEDLDTQFSDSKDIEVYIRSFEGFGGDGDLFGNFGLEIRDTLNIDMSKKRFEEEFPDIEVPREGDIIFFPFNKSFFEIKFVEDENPFYQGGKRYVYDIRCELFEFSDEQFVTGDDEVDDIGFDLDREVTDLTNNYHADNEEIQEESEDIMDFDPNNPFGE